MANTDPHTQNAAVALNAQNVANLAEPQVIERAQTCLAKAQVIDHAEHTADNHAPNTCQKSPSDYVHAYLDSLNAAQLRDLVRTLMDRYPEVAISMERASAFRFAPKEALAEMLNDEYKNTFSNRGFIDWHRAGDVAWEIDDFLNLLTSYAESDYTDIVEPILKRTVKRIQSLILRADDSGGMLGDTCQTALDLYAEVAARAQVNPAKLAKWLVKMRLDSPGWPDITLEPFVPATWRCWCGCFS